MKKNPYSHSRVMPFLFCKRWFFTTSYLWQHVLLIGEMNGKMKNKRLYQNKNFFSSNLDQENFSQSPETKNWIDGWKVGRTIKDNIVDQSRDKHYLFTKGVNSETKWWINSNYVRKKCGFILTNSKGRIGKQNDNTVTKDDKKALIRN